MYDGANTWPKFIIEVSLGQCCDQPVSLRPVYSMKPFYDPRIARSTPKGGFELLYRLRY